MVSRASAVAPSISELLRELESLRARLEQVAEAPDRPAIGLQAGAMAEEVKRLCRASLESDDAAEVAALLRDARSILHDLRSLLGPR